MSNFVRGSLLLTVATFLSKFLGLIYVVPFNALVGAEGASLYTYAYVPYNIILSIATIGIPLAMSKTISKYNALDDYATSRRSFRVGTFFMLITGIVSFLVMFFGADLIASWMTTNEDPMEGVVHADIVMVLKAVSFALLIIPAMSIMRGFFQGNESMGPSAISTVTEQIVRIAFVLISMFIVVVILDGTVATAVGFATFGAFVGGVGSWFVLMYYWKKRKPFLDKQLRNQRTRNRMPTRDILKEMLSYSGPFIIVGLATSLYQLVDTFTFQSTMIAAGYEESWAFGVINQFAHKIVIIPGTIATGLSLAVLPALTRTFSQNKKAEVHKQINQALQIVLVLVIPAVVGIYVLADVFYAALYGFEEDIAVTGALLAWYAPVGLLFALFTVTASMLQGINQQNFTVLSLAAGLLVKITLNVQFIYWFGAKGAIFATGLAVLVAVIINLLRIKRSVAFSYRKIFKRTLLILIFSSIMAGVVLLVKAVLGLFIPYETSRIGSIIVLLAGVGIGGGLYLWLAYVSTLFHHVFGGELPFVDKIIRKFRR
ncbi:putative polysaccharide biosynthesis protein [Oceanobacillus sp. CAU 1775]